LPGGFNILKTPGIEVLEKNSDKIKDEKSSSAVINELDSLNKPC